MTKNVLSTIYGSPDNPLKIGDTDIPCYVLEDETRVLARAGFVKAIGRKGKAKGGRQYDDEFQTPVFLSADNLKPFLPNDLGENSKPVMFKHNGMEIIGYKAEFLPQVCEVFLDAKEAGALKQNQLHIAEQCKIIHRGFARIGIIGLVDEATGYQEIRSKRALEAILDKYLRKELAAWAKKFPDDFYKEMFRLRGWPWNPASVKRPSVVGRFTNDLVYERLAPNILEELQGRNPKNDSGNRQHRHHQWLTEDIGDPALSQHLFALIALMRANTTWDGFYRSVQRALPKKNEQLSLLED